MRQTIITRNLLCEKCLTVKSSENLIQNCCNQQMRVLNHDEALFLGKKNKRDKRFKKLQSYWKAKKNKPTWVLLTVKEYLGNEYKYD